MPSNKRFLLIFGLGCLGMWLVFFLAVQTGMFDEEESVDYTSDYMPEEEVSYAVEEPAYEEVEAIEDDDYYGSDYTSGEELFNMNCASCHHPTQDAAGPALHGVDYEWMDESSLDNFYDYIQNTQYVVEDLNDEYAQSVQRNWGTYYNHQFDLSIDEIDRIWFDYIDEVAYEY